MQTAQQLFDDNVRHNTRLTKRKSKHKIEPRLRGEIYPVKVVGKVSPNEVIRELERRGVNIHRKTLLRWEQADLIPKAKRGSYGQGGGKWADYPDHTVEEALTVQVLREAHKLRGKALTKTRHEGLKGVNSFFSLLWDYYRTRFSEGKDYAEMLDIAKDIRANAGFQLVDGAIWFNIPTDLQNFRPSAWGEVFNQIVKEQGFVPIS